MVQIVPPKGWTGETVMVASAAVMAVADTPEPSFTHVVPPSDAVADMFEAAAAVARTPQVVDEPTPVTTELAPLTPAPTPAGSPLVLWSVVASAVILVGGLAIAVWPERETSNTSEPIAPVAAAAVAALPQNTVSDESAPPSTEPVAAPASEPHTAAKPISDESNTDTDVAADISDDQPGLPVAPAEEAAASTVIGDVSGTTSPEATAEVENKSPAPSTVAASSDQQRTPVLKFDPLDFDPSQFSIGTTSSTTPPASSSTDDPPGEAASAAGTPTESFELEENGILPPPPANRTITVRLGPVVNDAATVDVATLLEFEVDSLEVADVPLNRFIQMLSNISGVPVTLDPLAFELAGSSPRDKVTVAARDSTLDELLQGRLRAARLNSVERNGHVIISLADGDRRSPREFDVSDLMDAGAADASAVATLIKSFVSPPSWTSSNVPATIEVKGGKLRVEQSKAIQHEMLLFCERLRMARGLPRKSRYPSELISIDSPYTKLESRLAEKTTFTFLPWTPLTDVLQHWEKSSGITVLADWHRIADVDLGPSTPLSCSAVDRTWSEVLDETLEPLGLTWWTVDGTTVQITSSEALDEIHRIEFYSIPKTVRDQFTSGSVLLETLRAELSEKIGAPAVAAEQLQMQLDKPSRRLIVRGTPQIHRYLSERLRKAD
jgi:hypothetical protein